MFCHFFFVFLLTMRILLYIFFNLITFICFAQNKSFEALEVSKNDGKETFYININDKIFFQTFDHKNKRHGKVTDIQINKIQIDDSLYITISEIKSLISLQERHFLTSRAWTNIITGSVILVGASFLLQSKGYKSHKFIGSIGFLVGVPVLIKGVSFFIIGKTVRVKKWKLSPINF